MSSYVFFSMQVSLRGSVALLLGLFGSVALSFTPARAGGAGNFGRPVGIACSGSPTLVNGKHTCQVSGSKGGADFQVECSSAPVPFGSVHFCPVADSGIRGPRPHGVWN